MAAIVDFRYHLVSIVAVFLALAVGIVVGTTALNGPVLTDLNSRVAGLTSDKRALETQLRASQRVTADQDQAVALLAPTLAGTRLTGQSVVLVSTPDAPGALRDALVPLLTQAGATVTGSVRLRPALLDPASAQLVDDLVARVAVPGAVLPDGQPGDRALSQLAQVLVRRPGLPALPAQTTRRVLAAYSGSDLLDVTGSPDAPAALAVVLTGDPAQPAPSGAAAQQSDATSTSLLGLVRALDAAGAGTVVGGGPAAAGPGGLVTALRDDKGLTDRVSSVDTLGSATGRLAVVLALQGQLAGRSGSYGSGAGADAPVPDPAGK